LFQAEDEIVASALEFFKIAQLSRVPRKQKLPRGVLMSSLQQFGTFSLLRNLYTPQKDEDVFSA
jgi:hypothetical protein